MSLQAYQTPLLLAAFALAEIALKRFPWKGVPANETKFEIASIVASTAVIGPFVSLASLGIVSFLIPEFKDALINIPWWAWIPILLFGEDMLQYWWHRANHTFPILWRLHRPHHAAPYIGTRMTNRNGFFYILLFPNRWAAGLWLFLGGAAPLLVYGLIKGIVTTAAHSTVKWDSFLYKYKWLNPVAWIVERTISTPATHFAHHAKHEDDGIGVYNGNYGNLLFFWDVLFGTAKITRKYPAEFGIKEDDTLGAHTWLSQMFYPIYPLRRVPVVAKNQTAETELNLTQEDTDRDLKLSTP